MDDTFDDNRVPNAAEAEFEEMFKGMATLGQAPLTNGRAAPAARIAPAVRPKPESHFDGALLRTFRERKGLTLEQLAERTRIALRHLQNIEADAYAELPVRVYLRGMLVSIARELEEDPTRVSRTYLERVARHQRNGGPLQVPVENWNRRAVMAPPRGKPRPVAAPNQLGN